jgi:4-hydroxy-tetrahydrodipicolinate synthase
MSGDPILPVPLVTPLNGSEDVDGVAVQRVVDHALRGGADAVFALSTTGEFAGLRARARVELVEAVVTAVAGRVPIWAGVGDTSAARVRENVDPLGDLPVDAYVVCAPFYLGGLSQAELERHFLAVADTVPRPVVVYNIPQTTQARLEPATIARLGEHERILAVKDSSEDMSRFQETVRTAGAAGVPVYQGQERLAAVSLLAGAHGLVSGMGNLVPAVLAALHDACRRADLARARELQQWLSALSTAVSSEFWLCGIKACLEILGLAEEHTLGPRAAGVSAGLRDELARLLGSPPAPEGGQS